MQEIKISFIYNLYNFRDCYMCERKSWTKMEDKILKLLYEQQGQKKWSDVAEIMRAEYGILGRNGKQCRERYHNHLDQKISKAEWSTQEDQTLLVLHNKLGNRWALIARQIKGRTDNCVKNRFYSRFRRSIRNVNGLIKIFWKKQFKQLKPNFISKVIQITEEYRATLDETKKEIFDTCEDLKCRLMNFSDSTEQQLKQNRELQISLFELIKQINTFNRKNKRKGKKKKKANEFEFDGEEDFDSEDKTKTKTKNLQLNLVNQAPKRRGRAKVANKTSSVVKKEEVNQYNGHENPVLKSTEQNDQSQIQQNDGAVQQQKAICYNKMPLQIYEQIEKKKPETQEHIEAQFEDGFDINQFYYMEDLGHNHPPYFY